MKKLQCRNKTSYSNIHHKIHQVLHWRIIPANCNFTLQFWPLFLYDIWYHCAHESNCWDLATYCDRSRNIRQTTVQVLNKPTVHPHYLNHYSPYSSLGQTESEQAQTDAQCKGKLCVCTTTVSTVSQNWSRESVFKL